MQYQSDWLSTGFNQKVSQSNSTISMVKRYLCHLFVFDWDKQNIRNIKYAHKPNLRRTPMTRSAKNKYRVSLFCAILIRFAVSNSVLLFIIQTGFSIIICIWFYSILFGVIVYMVTASNFHWAWFCATNRKQLYSVLTVRNHVKYTKFIICVVQLNLKLKWKCLCHELNRQMTNNIGLVLLATFFHFYACCQTLKYS